MSGPRPFADLRETGLLWLINRVVLHPRGWALALHFADGGEAVETVDIPITRPVPHVSILPHMDFT